MPRPDEGLIHAWLDGQLPADEAARIERLAATDAEWAAAVAEARGLVAASSRILSALDHVPAGVIPQRTTAHTPRRLPWWTKAAAAVVVMVGASVLVMQRGTSIPVATVPAATQARDARVAATVVPTPAPSPTASSGAKSTTESVARKHEALPKDAAKRVAAAPVTVPVQALASQNALDAARATVDSSHALPQERAVVASALRGAAPAEESNERMRRDAVVAKSVVGGVAKGVPPAPASQAGMLLRAEGVGGNAPVASARQTSAVCYRLQGTRAPTETSFIMRTVRSTGDTIRLEPVQRRDIQRAWILWRDGTWQGRLSADSTGRGAEPVVATPVPCPVP
jgi:anti-sigma factor RsiW